MFYTILLTAYNIYLLVKSISFYILYPFPNYLQIYNKNLSIKWADYILDSLDLVTNARETSECKFEIIF